MGSSHSNHLSRPRAYSLQKSMQSRTPTLTYLSISKKPPLYSGDLNKIKAHGNMIRQRAQSTNTKVIYYAEDDLKMAQQILESMKNKEQGFDDYRIKRKKMTQSQTNLQIIRQPLTSNQEITNSKKMQQLKLQTIDQLPTHNSIINSQTQVAEAYYTPNIQIKTSLTEQNNLLKSPKSIIKNMQVELDPYYGQYQAQSQKRIRKVRAVGMQGFGKIQKRDKKLGPEKEDQKIAQIIDAYYQQMKVSTQNNIRKSSITKKQISMVTKRPRLFMQHF